MSRRTQFFLAGAVGALAAGAIATGVAAQTRSDDDVSIIVAQARADAQAAREAGRDAAQRGREAGERGREAARIAREHIREFRIERDGDVMFIGGGHDGKDRAEHLRNILQLRPNQEAALTAYLEAQKPQERTVRLERGSQERPQTTTERLARMEQRLNERQAAERARIEATRRFYNQLDAAQKKAFDELPLMMGPGPGVRVIRAMHRMPDMPPMPPAPPVRPVPPVPPTPRL